MQISRLNDLAMLSISRGCAFALLAIFCFMVGLSGFPIIALNSGAILLMLAAAVLLLKAETAPKKPYKRTEVWILLEPDERPSPEIAQFIIGTTLKAHFLSFSVYFAIAGLICFAAAVSLKLFGGFVI